MTPFAGDYPVPGSATGTELMPRPMHRVALLLPTKIELNGQPDV